ncbi:MAG TPA: sugar phosphate nucleotidyltransferase [Gemmatimonadales bacterium]|nr:sugar phosphate nucleotidyltransferase [Gemmatimonadales bacterium]
MNWAILLAGGAGTRFWPLSSPRQPKQLLPLTEDGRSTAEVTIEHLEGLVPPERILLVTGPALGPVLASSLRLAPENVLTEPRPASTAPAIVWATHEALRRDPDAQILTLHADWVIGDRTAFHQTASTALETAQAHDCLVTVGIVPSRPETGYGYIVPGPPLGGLARKVARFTEKPGAAKAMDLIAGGALWNSGLFAWTAARLLAEITRHTPEIAPALPALDAGDIEAFFGQVTAISIDVGLLERSNAVAVLPGAFAWDDVGNWDALHRVRQRDANGNVLVGRVHATDTHDCVAWSETTPVVLSGVRDLVVVAANGRILVMPREDAPQVKALLDLLPPDVRDLPS